MRIDLTTEQVALRDELRAYYAKLLTPEIKRALARGGGIGPTRRDVIRQMGADRWLGVGWPVEYGGRGLTPVEQFIFYDESMRAGAPVPMLTINTVGPTLMNHGTPAQREYFLPRILDGTVDFCIGYSEPGAGTDLAALSTRAVRSGDHYVINGQKLWTSLALEADWCWLAVRTDPEGRRHRGISVLLVDMRNTAGVTVQPLRLLTDHNVNQVFFEEARVPVENLVGEENAGWSLITNQLNHERVTLVSSGMLQRHVDEVRGWAMGCKTCDGGVLLETPDVALAFARIDARIEALRLMNWEVAVAATRGELHPQDASSMKVYGTELNVEVLRDLIEIVGQGAYVEADQPGSMCHELDRTLRGLMAMTFGGGTNELQRDLISMFALGFPRTR